MSAIEQQRGQVLRPLGDPGNLTPVQHLELQQKQQGAPQGYGQQPYQQPPPYQQQAQAPYQQQAHVPYAQPPHAQYQQPPHAQYQQPPHAQYQQQPPPYQRLPPYQQQQQQQQQFQRGTTQAWPPAQAQRPAGPMAPSTAASRLFNRPEMNGSQKQVQNRSYEMNRAAFLGDQTTTMSRRYQ
jgi:hypothetical protein